MANQIVGIGVSCKQPDTGEMDEKKFYYAKDYIPADIVSLVTQVIEAQGRQPVPDPDLGPAADIICVISTIVEDVP
jgi:hypothetical protein